MHIAILMACACHAGHSVLVRGATQKHMLLSDSVGVRANKTVKHALSECVITQFAAHKTKLTAFLH